MYINLKKSNVNKMARGTQKVRLGTQEGTLYQSLSKADGRKGLGDEGSVHSCLGAGCLSECFV